MNKSKTNLTQIVLIAAILVGAIELRCPITGVGSLVPIIRESLGLSHALAGMTTTIPLLTFGICSLLVSQCLQRFSAGNVVLTGICLIGSGIVIRSFLGAFGLFAGTVVIGIGIWWIAIYMGTQTLFFYCFVSWFATILQSKVYSAEMAGLFNSFYMLMGIPGSFSLPVIAARQKNQSGLGIALAVILTFLGYMAGRDKIIGV